ncbi:hypothetical protein DOTSEDRAFT_70173 [Dothistroma septosporum NZE10]|uniref:Uncharacterized protein n=1 Tax=Dothistroma septosporum (strain NZE10 / CBS 128990) TaxID=675120 RepID=N1PUK3_DOTSN|nr:hypothetical protein DOTSEDRAFT_70173 [Dothistroma septosporum NZE10]
MATPIVTCGVTSKMALEVALRLLPEYEVIQFITSVERAKSEIPPLQAGQEVTPNPDNIGTHNFSKPPKAVIFGRGFDDAQVEKIRQTCRGDAYGLSWLMGKKADVEKIKSSPPDFSKPEVVNAYADQVSAVNKATLTKLKADGKLGDGQLHYY